MKLHEAIRRVLQQVPGRRAHRTVIARAINLMGLYTRRDGAAVHGNQVSARTSKYTRMLVAVGHGIISLR